ncbi:prenyltransferase/squalene oxidase repeat-containing protein [Actinoplanes sp. CA-142083]|uniref:prenyltransferase/squalene oxidase repeat-containing protein n=1 Tax=Actinoplanes sp. CA-142083 TaxID=3239903 RepID=UPI003D8ACCEE
MTPETGPAREEGATASGTGPAAGNGGLGARIAAAVSRGLAFVLAAQEADGSWTEWDLPPGPSREWATAHTGMRLAQLGPAHRPAVAEPLGRAADWLLDHRAAAGGWGYNAVVDPDADSTAQALLLLAAAGRSAPAGACAFLARHQRPDGGFATYLPSPLAGSWSRSHAEITPIALLALRAHGGLPPDRLADGLAWLRRARREDGLWNSFWWSTPLVATEAALGCLAVLGVHEPLPQWTATDNLEAALLLSITAAWGRAPAIERLTHALLETQRDDGSWQCPPRLRVTDRACDRPWELPDAGPLFADPHRLHGTAIALAALATATAPDPAS